MELINPPPRELWLVLDCSRNTLIELFDVLETIKYIIDPEPEIKEVLKYINLQELNKKQLKYIYENIKWTENILDIETIITKLYYGERNVSMYQTKPKVPPVIKYMKKPIKNLNKESIDIK